MMDTFPAADTQNITGLNDREMSVLNSLLALDEIPLAAVRGWVDFFRREGLAIATSEKVLFLSSDTQRQSFTETLYYFELSKIGKDLDEVLSEITLIGPHRSVAVTNIEHHRHAKDFYSAVSLQLEVLMQQPLS
jgi:uncharacterized protein (DUF924 family)